MVIKTLINAFSDQKYHLQFLMAQFWFPKCPVEATVSFEDQNSYVIDRLLVAAESKKFSYPVIDEILN